MEGSKKHLRKRFAAQNNGSIQNEDDASEDELFCFKYPEDNFTYTKVKGYTHPKLQKKKNKFSCRGTVGYPSADALHITLHQAARDGNGRILQMFLDNLSLDAAKLKLNTLDDNRLAPLHYAARYNYVKVVELLITRGADVNIKGDDGLTPLHFASRYGYNKQIIQQVSEPCPMAACKSVICLLVQNRAIINCKDDYGMTPLHYAAMRGNEVAIQQLLSSPNVNTEVYDKQEMTPLHCAANYGNTEVLEMLLNAGSNALVYDENMSTPLHLAATSGNKDIVMVLLDAVEKRSGSEGVKSYIEEINNCKSTALHLAVDKGHAPIVDLLLDKGADLSVLREKYCQPLHLAAVTGNLNIVQSLIHHGAQVNCLNACRETPLHKAAAYNSVSVISYLLENNADLECRDNEHFTPLLIASSEGHVETIQLFLDAEANVGVVDKMDRSVIFWAAQENHPSALKILLEHPGTSSLINRCDRYDNSPLHIAALKGYKEIVEIMLGNCAEIERKNEHEETPLHLAAKHGHISVAEILLQHSKNIVNAEDENSSTPLHVAAYAGHHHMVSLLLNSGANIEARNCHMWSPLDCAACRGWKWTSEILLKAGCSVDPADKSKTTPLHLAAKEGHTEVVKLLLKWDADISLCDKNGKNCLDLAVDKGHEGAALEILSDKNWEQVLRNESDKNKFGIHQTPLRRLLKHMPDVAEFVFDKCIERNGYHDDHPKLEISYNYEFLDDIFARYQPHLYEQSATEDAVSVSEVSESSSFFNESDVYTKDGKVKHSAIPYSDNKEILKYNHPLMLMVTHNRQALLSHPLCSSLLQHKWQSYGRYVYYSNLVIFLFFLAFLTGYMITALPPCPSEDFMNEKCCWLSNVTCQPYIGKCELLSNQFYPEMCRHFIYVFAIIHLLKELYQMYQSGSRYLSLENFLEWSCYLSALLFVADITDCSEKTGIREVWQWELGSLSIFCAWMVLVMFISKFPFLGIYVIMFIQILSTFVNFSIVFFLFVVAFGLAFYALLQNQDPFETPGESIIKAAVMMIGELEFDAIFNDPENEVFYKGPAYLLFVLFLLLMAIIIMNLLVGLAVDDIKGVQEQAHLTRLAMKVELVLTVERLLPIVALRRCIIKTNTVSPNAWRNWPWIFKSLRARALSSYGSKDSDKSAIEELEEQQTKLSKQMKDIQESLRLLVRDTKQLKNLVENKLNISSESGI